MSVVAARRRLVMVGVPVALALVGLVWAAGGPPSEPVDAAVRRAGLVPREVDVGGLRLRYVRQGRGDAVVLVHGFASSLITWAEVIPGLAREHDVIAFDLPGFGGSEIPGQARLEAFPDAVLGVLDALGVGRADLVGNSLGGAAVVGVAATAPGRVGRLVLVDSAGFNAAPGERPTLLRLAAVPGVARMAELPGVRRGLMWVGLHQVFHDDSRVDGVFEAYLAPFARPGATAYAAAVLAAAPRTLRFEQIAAAVGAPTLVVWGREDLWIPVEQARLFGEAIRGSRVEVLDGCGHMPQEECAPRFLALVTGFLAGPPAGLPPTPEPARMPGDALP